MENRRGKLKTVTHFIFLVSKITADSDCSHEIKRRLLLGRKAMTNLDSILRSRDITLPTKMYIVKAMVFPIVMYGCEIWTIKKTDAEDDMLEVLKFSRSNFRTFFSYYRSLLKFMEPSSAEN